jgi:hypothetical protein
MGEVAALWIVHTAECTFTHVGISRPNHRTPLASLSGPNVPCL